MGRIFGPLNRLNLSVILLTRNFIDFVFKDSTRSPSVVSISLSQLYIITELPDTIKKSRRILECTPLSLSFSYIPFVDITKVNSISSSSSLVATPCVISYASLEENHKPPSIYIHLALLFFCFVFLILVTFLQTHLIIYIYTCTRCLSVSYLNNRWVKLQTKIK